MTKDLGDGWSIHDDGEDIELRDGDDVVLYVSDKNLLVIPAFGRLGQRKVKLGHLMELMIACRGTYRDILTVGAVAASTRHERIRKGERVVIVDTRSASRAAGWLVASDSTAWVVKTVKNFEKVWVPKGPKTMSWIVYVERATPHDIETLFPPD